MNADRMRLGQHMMVGLSVSLGGLTLLVVWQRFFSGTSARTQM